MILWESGLAPRATVRTQTLTGDFHAFLLPTLHLLTLLCSAQEQPLNMNVASHPLPEHLGS